MGEWSEEGERRWWLAGEEEEGEGGERFIFYARTKITFGSLSELSFFGLMASFLGELAMSCWISLESSKCIE